MAKLYGKNQIKKLVDGHNAVVKARQKVDDHVHAMTIAARQHVKGFPMYGGEHLTPINLIEKVIGKDRDYITDVIAKQWMGKLIPVPLLVSTPSTKDGFFSDEYQMRHPIKHKKNFELIMLEWCFDEPEPVRP